MLNVSDEWIKQTKVSKCGPWIPVGSWDFSRILQDQNYFNNNSKILFVFFTLLTFVVLVLKQHMIKWINKSGTKQY